MSAFEDIPGKSLPEQLEPYMAEVRRAVADYMRSEGCSCCQNVNAHKEHAARLAALLKVPAYDDGSGYDFYRFGSKPRAAAWTGGTK